MARSGEVAGGAASEGAAAFLGGAAAGVALSVVPRVADRALAAAGVEALTDVASGSSSARAAAIAGDHWHPCRFPHVCTAVAPSERACGGRLSVAQCSHGGTPEAWFEGGACTHKPTSVFLRACQ